MSANDLTIKLFPDPVLLGKTEILYRRCNDFSTMQPQKSNRLFVKDGTTRNLRQHASLYLCIDYLTRVKCCIGETRFE
jgi:hypothetical protein